MLLTLFIWIHIQESWDYIGSSRMAYDMVNDARFPENEVCCVMYVCICVMCVSLCLIEVCSCVCVVCENEVCLRHVWRMKYVCVCV